MTLPLISPSCASEWAQFMLEVLVTAIVHSFAQHLCVVTTLSKRLISYQRHLDTDCVHMDSVASLRVLYNSRQGDRVLLGSETERRLRLIFLQPIYSLPGRKPGHKQLRYHRRAGTFHVYLILHDPQ